MPYIPQLDRLFIDRRLQGLLVQTPRWSPGELAYVLYRIAQAWLGRDPNYAQFATLTGVLTETLAEVRRRMIVPYEKRKRRENGDV